MSEAARELWIGLPLAAGGVTAAFSYATFSAGSRVWGPVVVRGSRDKPPRVALTFDDGPHPTATPRVLEILHELGTPATFFVIGRNVERHPEVLRAVFAAGHTVGNHTYDHAGLGFLRGERFWRGQIEKTGHIVAATIGVEPRYFRPPLGMRTWLTYRAARDHVLVNWTRRGLDGVSTTPPKIVRRLVPRARPGDILTLHDGVSPQSRRDPSATLDALRDVILGLRARGITPVSLHELTGIEPYRTGSPIASQR